MGICLFTENGESCPMPEEEKIKLEMYKIYYAQHEFYRRFGCFAKTAEEAAACLPTGFAYDADAAKKQSLKQHHGILN